MRIEIAELQFVFKSANVGFRSTVTKDKHWQKSEKARKIVPAMACKQTKTFRSNGFRHISVFKSIKLFYTLAKTML